MLTTDFETEAIDGNPVYNPPKPVGVSIKKEGEASKYYAWGHPTENNCSFEDGRAALLSALHEDKEGYLAHNAPFESSIKKKYFGYTQKDPLKVFDSQYSLFLQDPYAQSFSLKPSAERVLGWAPSEQDEVKNWILGHVAGVKPSEWGAHICKVPGSLAGKYAEGDTDRTRALHDFLHPKILQAGMLEAYQREQKLMPILSASSERGVRLDVEGLAKDVEFYKKAKKYAEDYIYRTLGEFNIDSGAELAAALDRAGQVTEWVLTPTGKRSTARKNLAGRVKDPELLAYMSYQGVLSTCLGTFAGPWLEQAESEGGRLHPQWNQVRGDKGADGDMSGTRTGRMSCKGPNLQNVIVDFLNVLSILPDAIRGMFWKWSLEEGRTISPVPLMRKYLLPEIGHIWVKRDFSAQEMRIMAHFAEGALYEAFRKNPKTDPHQVVKEIIDRMIGGDMPRKYVKITGFGIMFGRGVPNLSIALGVAQEEGKRVRDAYYAALPEVRELSYDVRNRGKRGQYIRTWGGRIYYREPDPARDLSYKLLNYLIQGSAADQIKQTAIDWDATRAPDDTLLALVHDEVNLSIPQEDVVGGMYCLKSAMNYERFDVPFESEGFTGQNWSELNDYED